MGTTAEKLTYLNTTKTKIKDAINLANTSITNETFRLYEEKIKQAIINTMLDKWKVWDNFDKVIGSGTGLTLNNTHKAPLKLDLNGNTQQESTTGKNLYYITPQTVNGVTLSYASDGAIVLNGKSNAGFTAITTNLTLSGNYTLSVKNAVAEAQTHVRTRNSNNNLVHSITLDTTTDKTNTQNNSVAKLEITIGAQNITYTNFKIYVQLESGGTATTFEKATLGASPNPNYPQDIHLVSGDNTINICGKNLFDKDSEDVGHVYSSTGSYGESAVWTTSDWIAVESNTQYSLSFKTTGTANLFFSEFNKNKEFIQRTTTGTLTPQSNTKYVRVSYKNDLGTYDIQLEKGSTSSEYEAYTGASYPINLPVENLFDYTLFNNFTSGNQTLTLTLKPNTTYIMSSNIPAYSVDSSANLFAYNSTSSPSTNTNGIKPNIPRQITTNADGIIKITYRNLGDELISPKTTYWYQIELGTKANSYTPYGTTPIEYCGIGDYKNKFIRTSGKNLFDKENASILAAYIDTNIIDTSAKAKTTYISCKPNTTYTISKTNKGNNNRFTIATTSSTPALNVSVSQYNNNNSASTMTITTNSTANYLCLTFYHTDETSLTMQQVLDSIQIEKNNEATSYEPFGINEWWYKEAVHKRILDGTEDSWTNFAIETSGLGRAIVNGDNVYYKDSEATILCDKLIGVQYSGSWSKTFECISSYSSNRFIAYLSNVADLTEFKNKLASGFTIYYVLAIPTYTKITDYTLLSQLEAIYNAISMQGVTNIFQENNDLPFNIDATALEEI